MESPRNHAMPPVYRFGGVQWIFVLLVLINAYDFVSDGYRLKDALMLAGVLIATVTLGVRGPMAAGADRRLPWRDSDALGRWAAVFGGVGLALMIASLLVPTLG